MTDTILAEAPGARNLPDHVPPHLARDFDYRRAPAIADDPWTYFADALSGPPIFWSTAHGGHWVITGTPAVEEVFRRHDLFSNGVPSIPAPRRPQAIPGGLDPPEHGKYRKIISQRMFSPRALASIEADMAAVLDRLCADILPRGECEFVADLARPLPVALLLRMIGLPEQVRDDLTEWVRLMFHGRSLEENIAGYRAAFDYLGRWLDAQLEGDGPPPGLVLPALVAARVDDRPLTYDEMHSMTLLLLGAGVDTVTAQMAHVMRHLATHPDDARALADDPGLIPSAVEEFLRRYGIANIARVVAADIDYRGVTMRRGDLVLLANALAGLDPATFPDPLSARLDRPRGPFGNVPFGAGPHLCPGAYLARTILRAMIARLAPAMPGLRLGPDAEGAYVSGVTVSLTRLPLRWDPPPTAR